MRRRRWKTGLWILALIACAEVWARSQYWPAGAEWVNSKEADFWIAATGGEAITIARFPMSPSLSLGVSSGWHFFDQPCELGNIGDDGGGLVGAAPAGSRVWGRGGAIPIGAVLDTGREWYSGADDLRGNGRCAGATS